MGPRKRRVKDYGELVPLPGDPNYVDWKAISEFQLAFEDLYAYKPRVKNPTCSPRTPPGTPPRFQQLAPRHVHEDASDTTASLSSEEPLPKVPSADKAEVRTKPRATDTSTPSFEALRASSPSQEVGRSVLTSASVGSPSPSSKGSGERASESRLRGSSASSLSRNVPYAMRTSASMTAASKRSTQLDSYEHRKIPRIFETFESRRFRVAESSPLPDIHHRSIFPSDISAIHPMDVEDTSREMMRFEKNGRKKDDRTSASDVPPPSQLGSRASKRQQVSPKHSGPKSSSFNALPAEPSVLLLEKSFHRQCPRVLSSTLASDTSALRSFLAPSAPEDVPLDPLQELLSICSQTCLITFEQALRLSKIKECKKLGEGSYGEVFLVSHQQEVSAVKVVPIEGAVLYNGDEQLTARNILAEVVISRKLSDLRRGQNNRCSTFVQLKRMHCVKDKFHPAMFQAWLEYDRETKSENDRPDILPEDQMFAVFEFAASGKDLNPHDLSEPKQACSVLLQAACALAVAECKLRFEHRDLHLGNILVATTTSTFVRYLIGGRSIEVTAYGVRVTIIDFTLSRMQQGNCVLYTDMSKGDFFDGQGLYQYDMYRFMREWNKNNWKRYLPRTNTLWLYYVASQLKTKVFKGNPDRDKYQKRLQKWLQQLFEETSATSFVEKLLRSKTNFR
ncbi:serine/threonine-protein kinase haspin-like [Ornithodoros turicata]|uniref:serine/threonine-protein kinase haspin-like n=1 Tax=Ornithodoros turicata TaxID=34597 RepID=UPI003139C266